MTDAIKGALTLTAIASGISAWVAWRQYHWTCARVFYRVGAFWWAVAEAVMHFRTRWAEYRTVADQKAVGNDL